MGASCSRWDCNVVVEDCTSKTLAKRPSFWYDCAGQNVPGSNSSGWQRDASELLATHELEVQLVCDRFALRKSAAPGAVSGTEWRRRYVLGRELGAGQTAVVFEAYAVATSLEESSAVSIGCSPEQVACGSSLGSTGSEFCSTPKQRGAGRRVALKRFFNAGTLMFQQELKALTDVGVHPHVLRLLECFEGAEQDILVLEYCDGGDVYELYAQNNGCAMLESYVMQLVCQVILALQHLVERGVEHRDVKPENLLLYGSPADNLSAPHLKLADFGWAAVLKPSGGLPPVPPEGVGSLWYAPPELNPPVPGARVAFSSDAPPGRSDMWSVGVITYLLLVGHSPFNPALRVTDPAAREAEVIRLAAFGQINKATRPWTHLSEDARNFVCALLAPEATKRLSPMEAWKHPFVARGLAAKDGASVKHQLQLEDERCNKWKQLDGFQRLCWMAFARAIAEPELCEVPGLENFISQQSIGSTMYLEQLAVELAAAAVPTWFGPQAAWLDILSLAFRYLDTDSDGILGVGDLMHHLAGEDAKECADSWVSKWQHSPEGHSLALRGLGFAEFQWALLYRHAQTGHPESAESPDSAGPVALLGIGDAMLERRMQDIDDVCVRFLDEEFTGL